MDRQIRNSSPQNVSEVGVMIEEEEEEDNVDDEREETGPRAVDVLASVGPDEGDDEDDDDDDDDDEDDDDDPNNQVDVTQEQQEPKENQHIQQYQKSNSQQQQQQQQPISHQNHIQLLMNALEKLDPDKNGLTLVPEEITSSTLTTRLKGVCKINRLIDHSNDLCHSFSEIGAQAKYQESTNKFRDWILRNKIIEYIFGPNCHVEIIKQSHTILNFVAYSLNDEHVDVIWSASLLKHCGRQVLDLLTSLVRFMRTGPVLHLYWLVRNLYIEDHSEHTLLLTSHILRFIWSHSPCINQIQFCNLQQKSRQRQEEQQQERQQHLMQQDQHQYPHQQPAHQHHPHANQHIQDLDSHRQQSLQTFLKQNSFRQSQFQHPPNQQRDQQHSHIRQPQLRSTRINSVSGSDTDTSTKPNAAAIITTQATSSTVTNTATSIRFANDDHCQWLASRIFPGGNNDELAERSASSRSTSESVDLDTDLQQSLIDAIKGVTQQPPHQNLTVAPSSPVNEPTTTTSTIAVKASSDGKRQPEDVKRSVVDHILQYMSSDNTNQSSSQQKQCIIENDETSDPAQSLQCNLDSDTDQREWFRQLKDNTDFLDNTSDVSACCSEDKNMEDFEVDDEVQAFMGAGNAMVGADLMSANNSNSSELFNSLSHSMETSKPDAINVSSNRSNANNLDNNGEILCINDSNSTSRDSEAKFRLGLDQCADQFDHLPLESIAQFKELKKASCNLSNVTHQLSEDNDLKGLSEYNLGNLSDPGKTLLWDLLQDGKIEHLATNLHVEVENVLVNLVMSFGDRYIRYKFIEACLENLSAGTSVIISLRLLPKLMSFNNITRNLTGQAVNETHTIVLWAEREHNMSQNFFKNLVEYYKQRQQLLYQKFLFDGQSTTAISNDQQRQFEEFTEQNCKSPLYSHIDKIITRMSFLTFIYSKPFSPETMRLNREQVDQLWDCLASDSNPRCADVLFQWIYQQAIGDDFHGVNDELLDYILKHKMPSFDPKYFRLRGLKLLEQLLWIRQDYECCHGLEYPSTRLLWDTALKAVDDECSMAAIRILNHFYIYTNHQKTLKCDKGTNFMNHCMEQLHSSLTNLSNSDDDDLKGVNQLLDVMQKVIILIRTHLEVFKARWSFYLRTLQLNNEADLISHRLNCYEVKLTMTVRLVCQAASSMDKTTIEMQAGDFVGELRAEIAKWWYSQVDRTYLEQSTVFSPTSSTNSSSASSTNINLTNSQEDPQNDKERQNACKKPLNADTNADPGSMNTFTEFLLSNHHSLRLLSHNQEIPFEWDERQINELDFKDMQVIYVLNDIKSTNADQTDELASNKSNESAHHPPHLPKTEIPSILLLRYEYFERLMEADRFLGSFQSKNQDLTNRAKTLSRRVWEIIQILPTCPHYREDLKRCGTPDENWRLKTSQCSTLLSAECPQRLLYSLQIIDILKSSNDNPAWGTIFIRKGGLSDIFDVFMSQKLLPGDNEDWNEWLQECLAYLLKLLFQFGIRQPSNLANDSSSSSSSSKMSVSTCSNRTIMTGISSVKRARRNRGRVLGTTEDRLPIPLFSDELLKLLANTDLIFNKLIWILKSSALCKSQSDQYYYVTMSSRAMIVHHVMGFLSSWCKSDPKFPKFQVADYEQLLKALILDDTDSSTRREACNGFFKLHHACSTKLANTSIESINSTLNTSLDSSSDVNVCQADSFHETNCWTYSADLLKCLIKFLPIAEAMKPPKPIRNYASENDYIKEINSPGCKDYFWLTCRLIDSQATMSLSSESKPIIGSSDQQRQQQQKDLTGSVDEPMSEGNSESTVKSPPRVKFTTVSKSSINLFELCQYLVVAIRKRQTYETRDFSVEDDTLRGMLHMMVMSLRRDPSFRYTSTAFDFIHELHEYLFAAPTQSQRYLPKCKSPATRSTAFDLMIALVEHCPKNYFGLLELLLIDQHNSVVKGTYPTDYWPHDDCRSEVGFVGLINLGATCYLATCMQHLFMIPNLRYAILSIEDTKSIRHGEIIRELQKIFTFMLESERKAYNPRNFCKVYTMDNHPLNIAEQTDMTEFLTDLITKLEESSPELRQIIKGLFSGTLSNNVVSLDCPHISRTTEEFYTLRVQVADMRNLNDSLDELTVKDTLEGDNMYTCSTCEKKVRAEKRACIVKLPRILCFNTMRYTFNMATMTKEKVNTHFSFPLRLDMADYLEANLMKRQQSSNAGSGYSSKDSLSGSSSSGSCKPSDGAKDTDCQQQDIVFEEGKRATDHQHTSPTPRSTANDANSPGSCSSEPISSASDMIRNDDSTQEADTIYELIGVTVHTGNADGGHYYCFIRDCEDQSTDKPRWYLFNDAEVKLFDYAQLGHECYGGELTTKSYDAINDRFMDFSIEKTNSAYMLFYKRVDYKYHSRSVALRYLESDTQRSSPPNIDSYLNCTIKRSRSDSKMEDMEADSGTRQSSSSSSSTDINNETSVSNHQKPFNISSSEDNSNNSSVVPKLMTSELNFNDLCQRTYEDFELPKYLANWIWMDNMKFARDKNVFEHNYFNFMWQVCANLPRTLNHIPEHLADDSQLSSTSQASEDAIAIRTVHLAIAFVLGVLMNSRERPNLSNWTELIRKQFNSSKAACDWLMHLIDDEETWLKQMLLKCPIEMVRQLFQRLCNDLTGSKQHKKLRLIR